MIKSFSLSMKQGHDLPVKTVSKTFCIIDKSIQIKNLSNNSFLLQFEYISQSQIFISVYVNVNETENTQNGQTYDMETPINIGYQVHLDLPESQKKLVKIKIPLNLENYVNQNFSFSKYLSFWKLAFRIESQDEVNCQINYIYYDVIKENNDIILRQQKNKLETKEGVYLVFDIYGIQNRQNIDQGAKKEFFEQKCNICIADIATVMILSCRHVCLCKDCAFEYNVKNENNFYKVKRECPVCRNKIEGLLKINNLE